MNDFFNDLLLNDIRTEIIKFNNDNNIAQLKAYYNEKSFPEILGVSRKEIIHSNFLSWILNPYESHGLKYFTITKLFEILISRKILARR